MGPEQHSWRPRSLVELAGQRPEPPTIGELLYPAKRTIFSGETESLKTWLALVLSKAELDAGFSVAWADLDAMGSGEILDRLKTLGVGEEAIEERFLYYEPTETLKAGRLDDVCSLLREFQVRLFVIDAFNPILTLHGLDPSSTTDVETFWREIATPITDAGAAPTLLDHVVKNAEGRGKYAYGSERKASGAIVHVGFQPLEPFTRGGTGRTLLTTHKDRPGYLPRPKIGRFVLTSDGQNIQYHLEAEQTHARDKFRPTHLMERASRAVEAEAEAVSRTWVEKNVQGNAAWIRAAIDVLVDEGYFVKDETSRGWKLTSVRAYREDEDLAVEDEDETASIPRPYRVPSLVSVGPDPTASTRPSPKDGRGRESVGNRVHDHDHNRVHSPSKPGLVPGGSGFLELVAAAYRDGHLTEKEAQARWRLHKDLVAAGFEPEDVAA